MTAICAVEHAGGAVLACDSFVGDESYRDLTDSPKWTRRGGIIIACAGNVRASHIAEHARFRRQRANESDFDYLTSAVAESIRDAHDDRDVSDENFQAVILFRSKVYCMLDEYAVLRSLHGYAAIGAGADVLLGSLASTDGQKPRARAEIALNAAARHSNHVSAPFHFTEVKR